MTSRADIIAVDIKSVDFIRRGLIYTELCGWIDLGHADPEGAMKLWSDILDSQSQMALSFGGTLLPLKIPNRSINNGPRSVTYGQRMGKSILGHMRQVGVAKNYWIDYGLSINELQSVALSIFMEVSVSFEAYQLNYEKVKITKSSFSVEDLVSNLIGFYRAVLPSDDYVSRCNPISQKEALKLWDAMGDIGDYKNKEFSPILFSMDEDGTVATKRVELPGFLRQIKPAFKGSAFGDSA